MSIPTSLRNASIPLIFLLAAVTLAGCGIGPLAPSVVTSSSPGAISGGIHGGQPPVSGSHIYLYAVSSGGYGTPSTSLLQAGANTTSDGTNYYVTSGADGGFSISGDYSCSSGQALYLYATGGSAGQGSNSAIGFLAALGTCPGGNIAAAVPFVWVNEVSTVVAAYALGGFAVSPTAIASSNTALAKTGVANAIANVPNVLNIATGNALSVTAASNSGYTGTVPVAKINTLANILAACINSASSSSTACATLFANAPDSTGVQPTDTAQAALNMAHVPAGYTPNSIKNLYGLSSAQPAFANALTSVPNDLALPIVYAIPDINNVSVMAADATGAIYAAASSSAGGNALLYKFSPLGVGSETTLDTSYGINALAISSTNQIWLADTSNSALRVFDSTPTLQFSATGGALLYPQYLAFDSSGNVFAANYYGNVSEFGPTGNPVVTAGYPTTASNPSTIGVDSTNSLWLGSEAVSTYMPPPYTAAVAHSYGGASGTFAIALDNANAAWFNGNSDNTLVRVTAAGVKTTCHQGGLSGPYRIAVDGAGNIYAANGLAVAAQQSDGTISAFTSTCTAISGSNGIVNGSPRAAGNSGIRPVGLTIDGSGNVWTINIGSNGSTGIGNLSQFLGLAVPVATPILPGQLGKRP